MKKITIVTPIYNRANIIERLYESLKKQINKDFIWMIVDDGSTDNIDELVHKFENEKKVDITYIKKENGGKHTALNLGISMVKTELVFIVDSDDWLVENAINIIINKFKLVDKSRNICGITFLRKNENEEINGKKFKKDGMEGSYIDVRINKKIDGDKAEVFYTEIIKQFPFPVFAEEKFLGEDVVWIQMALKYNMIYYNIPVYVGEYLNDGLTKNRRTNNVKSPRGASYRGNIFMNKKCKLDARIKGCLSYIVYGKFANIGFLSLLKNTQYKIIFLLFYIPSIIIYKIWRKKYEEN